jgi:hypothetical protein
MEALQMAQQPNNLEPNATQLLHMMRTTQLAQFTALKGAVQALANELHIHSTHPKPITPDDYTADDRRRPTGHPSPVVKIQTLDDLIDELDHLQNRVARLEDGR